MSAKIHALLLLIAGSLACSLLPTQAGAAARLPFTSGFETGDFSEWNGGRDASLSVTDTSSCSGNYSARAVMTQGTPTDNYKDFYFGDHNTVGGAPASGGLWLELCTKFSQDFQFGNDNLHKIAIINFTDSNAQRRYQIVLNIWVSTERFFIENLSWNADGSFGGAIAGHNQNVGTPVSLRRGQWDRVRLYIRPNTPGQSNGIIRMWVNGVLKAEYTNSRMRGDTSFNPNKLILSNYAPATQTSGSQYWDDFYLGETEPGAQLAPPNPPTINE